jgi:VanZ family protein
MRIERRRTYSRWAFSVCLVVVLVAALVPPQAIASPVVWDKANHALAFAVLGMLACLGYPERKLPVLLGLVAYGVLIELLQSLTDYRTGDALDVVADGIGLLLGWTFTHLPWRPRSAAQLRNDDS